MKWISSLCQVLNKSVSVEESWVQMTTSLRQADFNILHKKNSSIPAYSSGSLLVTKQPETNGQGSVKHQRQEIFPSVLNRLEGKFKANRISKRKKSK